MTAGGSESAATETAATARRDATDDRDQRRVTGEDQEAEEHQDVRDGHALAGGVSSSLGAGELLGPQRGGLGGQRRFDLRPLLTRQAHTGGEFLELVDTQLDAQRVERVPR